MTMPPALNERNVEHFHKQDAKGPVPDLAIAGMVGAVQAARVAAEQLSGLAQAFAADATVTPAAAAARVKDNAEKLAGKIAGQLDQARAKAAGEIDALDKSMTPQEPLRATEIRQALRAQTKTERGKIIAAAIEAGDESVTFSVFGQGVTPLLIGMPATELAVRQIAFRHATYASELERRGRLVKALAAFDRAGNAFLKLIDGLVSSPSAVKAAAGADRTAKAQTATEGA